ncbi:transcriptional regulator [Bordetella pertussis]|nr:transcriptional regulator [Bordetella pertussis]
MYRLYQAWSQSNPVFVRLCEGRYGIGALCRKG